MPPSLDLYVISPERNRETIERFLAIYVDRVASENRGNEELMLVALGASGHPLSDDDWDAYDWAPSKTLTHIVERGLQFPRRAFAVYLKPLDGSLAGAVLAFDLDNQVIFGLSIDDEGSKSENLGRAKALLHEMAEGFRATRGFIAVEEPPPLWGTRKPPRTPMWSWPSAR